MHIQKTNGINHQRTGEQVRGWDSQQISIKKEVIYHIKYN